MSPHTPSVEMVTLAAEKLGDLCSRVVFLGGAVVDLLVTDSVASPARPTDDVDVVVEVAGYIGYHELESELRARGFGNVIEGPICRFRHGGLILDAMPTDANVFGFGNRWYAHALESAVPYELPTGRYIRLIAAPCFLATKLDAFDSPDREGHGDMVASKDFEDIVRVLNGRGAIASEVRGSSDHLRVWLEEQFRTLALDPRLPDGLVAHLDTDWASQARVSLVLGRIRKLAGLGDA